MKGIEIHLELGPTIDVRSGVLAGSVADMIPMWQTLVHAPSIFSTRQAIPSVIGARNEQNCTASASSKRDNPQELRFHLMIARETPVTRKSDPAQCNLEKDEAMAYQSVNPYDGKILKTFEELSDKQLETALATAATCFETWRYTTFAQRADRGCESLRYYA